MKLSEITNTILWAGELEGESVVFCAERAGVKTATLSLASDGGIMKGVGGALKFLSNPVVAALAAGYASKAYDTYIKNKRYTTHFFAKSAQERTFYTKVVADLMKTGHYKKIRQMTVDGGTMWVLKRDEI